MKKTEIFTDGACRGNPGPGGWGALLRFQEHEKELSGYEEDTTNNRMELTAVIEGLAALKKPCRVDLYTDSSYVGKGISQWMKNWRRNDWKRKEGKRWAPVKNVELWKRLDELINRHQVSYHWVAGHSGHPENERCDEMAVQAYQQYL